MASLVVKTKIDIRELSCEFGVRGGVVTALRDVTVEIDDGEIVAILGPSGCGKTTLLNVVAGFVRPTTGSVRIDQEEVTGPGPDRGVVFQESALFRWLTVEENVEFGLKMRGVAREHRREIAARFIKLVGLTEFGDRYPYQLSGGMKQRVAIARVFANESEILLMDEPFASLDAQTRDIMQEELLALWQASKRTILFVTHSAEEALFLSSRVLIMSSRPATIKKIVQVELPENRFDYHVRTSRPFTALKEHVLEMVRGEVGRDGRCGAGG